MKQLPECIPPLVRCGISQDDAMSLRRCALTLRSWYELECGNERGCIQRDETTGLPRMHDVDSRGAYDPVGRPIADRETGALRGIRKIMAAYPTLSYYVQGDPRGASLYILRPGDVPEGQTPDSCYSRGLAIYK